MKKKVSFVKRINQWTKAGRLPVNGLCNALTHAERKVFDLFEPTFQEKQALHNEGLCSTYWGSGMKEGFGWESTEVAMERRFGLTSLRQTLLCFCALLNKEL